MSKSFTMKRHDQKGRIVAVVLALFVLVLIVCSGCEGERISRVAMATAGSYSAPYKEFVDDPVTLSTVKTVVVFPFVSHVDEEGFSPDAFAKNIANKLASSGKVRVIYPNEAMEAVKRENLRIRRHNAEYRERQQLGQKLSSARDAQRRRAEGELRDNISESEDKRMEYLDPTAKLEDAIRVGRMLRADAIIVGSVTDFDPYTRPRVSLWMQVAATGTTASQAKELSTLCQWGVPLNSRSSRGVVWYRQQTFDTRDGNIGAAAYTYALKHHVQHSPLDTETYIRSPSMFLDYVAGVLSQSFVNAREDSIEEAEKRAEAEAKKMNQSKEVAQSRIRNLLFGQTKLPSGEEVMDNNHQNRTANQWRPDIYNRDHPEKSSGVYSADNMAK